MLFKYKHKLEKKSINNLTLRLQRKGVDLYPIYFFVIIHKKSRESKGRFLDKIGTYNLNYDQRILFFDSIKLYYWLECGVVIHYKVKRILMKFFLINKKKI